MVANPTPATVPSWEEIEQHAKPLGLKVLHRRMSASVYTSTLIVSHVLDLSIGDLEDEDADRMLRAMLWQALDVWSRMS